MPHAVSEPIEWKYRGDCFVPAMWADEGNKILEENMVVGHIVHRDLSGWDISGCASPCR